MFHITAKWLHNGTVVAQVCNLLYRRFEIGCACETATIVEHSSGSQNAILRYGTRC